MNTDWSLDPRSESSLERNGHDYLLYEEVCHALLQSPEINSTGIGVEVSHGVVTLRGHVRDEGERSLVENLTLAVNGVRDVVNLIDHAKFDAGDDPGGAIKGIR